MIVLCAACHNAKTVTQDGGFGRPVQPASPPQPCS